MVEGSESSSSAFVSSAPFLILCLKWQRGEAFRWVVSKLKTSKRLPASVEEETVETSGLEYFFHLTDTEAQTPPFVKLLELIRSPAFSFSTLLLLFSAYLHDLALQRLLIRHLEIIHHSKQGDWNFVELLVVLKTMTITSRGLIKFGEIPPTVRWVLVAGREKLRFCWNSGRHSTWTFFSCVIFTLNWTLFNFRWDTVKNKIDVLLTKCDAFISNKHGLI